MNGEYCEGNVRPLHTNFKTCAENCFWWPKRCSLLHFSWRYIIPFACHNPTDWFDYTSERHNLTEDQAPKKETRKEITKKKAYLPVLYKRVSSSHSRLPSPTQVTSNSGCQASPSCNTNISMWRNIAVKFLLIISSLYAHTCSEWGGERKRRAEKRRNGTRKWKQGRWWQQQGGARGEVLMRARR